MRPGYPDGIIAADRCPNFYLTLTAWDGAFPLRVQEVLRLLAMTRKIQATMVWLAVLLVPGLARAAEPKSTGCRSFARQQIGA
jgi:hypothetical protein